MAAVKIGIEVKGAKAIGRALKVLGETDAPFLKKALEESGELLEGATRSRAPGSMAQKVAFTRVTGKGATMRATVVVRHGGAKSMEFGRLYYYRGYTGRSMKATGQRFRSSKGQKAKPFVGVMKGDQAMGAVKPQVKAKIEAAITKEWERIAGGPD